MSNLLRGLNTIKGRLILWRKSGSSKRWFGSNLMLLLMCLPAVAHISLFGYATLPWLLVAFKQYRASDGLWGSAWVGFKNFEFLFTSTAKGWTVTRNTIAYNAAFIVLGTILALLLALLLAEIFRSVWSKIFQTALFLPNFLSWVVVGFATFALFDTHTGMLNAFLTSLGRDPIRWYQSPQYWPGILVSLGIWKQLGVTSLIYLAAILAVDPQIYESAQLDGANKWQQTWKITLPLIMPQIVILTLLSIGRIMYADFGLFYQLPQVYMNTSLISATDVLDTFVYRSLISLNQVGMATAAGLFQSVVGLVLIVLAYLGVRKIDPNRELM